MGARRKAIRTGILFIALLIVSGVVLMYRGNDAVFLATQRKDGILTAEQIKLSFDSVGRRLDAQRQKFIQSCGLHVEHAGKERCLWTFTEQFISFGI